MKRKLVLLAGLVLSLLMVAAGWHLHFLVRSQITKPEVARPLPEDTMRPAEMPRR